MDGSSRCSMRLPPMIFGVCLFSMCTVSARPGLARVEEPLQYTKVQSFRSALRFLRVDNGYKIVEKDSDSGYLLFEYPNDGRGVTSGSVEVIEREDSVALVVQLPQMPSYHERHLIEGLLKKLRTDYGEPPRREKPPAHDEPEEAPPPKDRGAKDEAPEGSPSAPSR